MGSLTGLSAATVRGSYKMFTFPATACGTDDVIAIDFGSTATLVRLAYLNLQVTVAGSSTYVTPEFHNAATPVSSGATATILPSPSWGTDTPGLTFNAGSPTVFLMTESGVLYFRPKPNSTGTTLRFKIAFEVI